jgi:CheY-like chemotaxis protein
VGAEQQSLPPLRLLIVEDETLISLLIETTVRELGHEPVRCAFSVPEALSILDEDGDEPAIDAAMLDVNLGGRLVFPVAEALERRKIPFAFVTGYGAYGVPESYASATVVQKPFTEEDLASVCTSLQRACFAGNCGGQA